ncbi:valyl-tRNA synthetase [Neisseria gonorrhoeae]|uniref:valine--tRNA ligase n=1 Tax=Neisseria gonorrhoeae TaxID=485 RepID=A0A379B0J4_NEIGO|nr:valyl-tRNA synthetase [Neisseria gonorrhoeae]
MWIIGRLNQTIEQVTQAYETYRFDLAAETLYSFVWNDYCDWYLELAKVQLQTGCASRQRATRHTLLRVLEAALRLLHPIIPFITEELWQTVAPMCDAKTADSIMLARFPETDGGEIVQTAFGQMTVLQDLIGAVRNLRGETGIQPNVKAPLFVESADDLADYLKYLPMMTRLTEARQVAALPESGDAPVAVCNGARLMLKVEIDKAAETARLSKEAEKLQKPWTNSMPNSPNPATPKSPGASGGKDKADLAELEDKMAKCKISWRS